LMKPTSFVFALAIAALPMGVLAQSEPFVINANLPLTGQMAFFGNQTAAALHALEQYTNAHGGIRGHPVKFAIMDDQSNPSLEVQLVSQAIAKHPAAIIGGAQTAMCNAATGLLKADDGPVYYCLSAGVHPLPGSWVYSAGASTVNEIAMAVHYLHESGLTRIATLMTTDASGQDGDQNVAQALARNKGVELVAREHFGNTDLSVLAQLARIKAAGAQAIIAWTTGTPFGTVLGGLRDTGYDLPVVTTPANMVYQQLDQYKSVMPKAPLLMPGIPAIVPEAITDRGVHQEIMNFYAAMKPQGVDKPDIGAAVAWDVGRVVLEGYRKLGVDATAIQMRDFINNLRGFNNVFGVYNYPDSPQRGTPSNWNLMVRWNPDTSRFIAVSKVGGEPLK
jgi:branched-chain amino acid transport system substrate-binding protein